MKNFLKNCIPVLVIILVSVLTVNAEQVKSLNFTGITNTEKVIITIEGKNQLLEYFTPRRNYRYEILDYDFKEDFNTGEKTLECTVFDAIYSSAYKVLLYSNNAYSDIRIDKKRVSFKHVEQFDVERNAK